jgi:hypothetical protein
MPSMTTATAARRTQRLFQHVAPARTAAADDDGEWLGLKKGLNVEVVSALELACTGQGLTPVPLPRSPPSTYICPPST